MNKLHNLSPAKVFIDVTTWTFIPVRKNCLHKNGKSVACWRVFIGAKVLFQTRESSSTCQRLEPISKPLFSDTVKVLTEDLQRKVTCNDVYGMRISPATNDGVTYVLARSRATCARRVPTM